MLAGNTRSDSILWYNVGIFGDHGYAYPNPSNDFGSLNPNIMEFVQMAGTELFTIMHHHDSLMTTPPSVNTLKRIHDLYKRGMQILAARSVPHGMEDMETFHTNISGDFFRVYPIPYFKVRSIFMKSTASLMLMMISEAMQHTENVKPMEVSVTFAHDMEKFLKRVYYRMATEYFGKAREEASDVTFLLSDEDFAAYDPTKFFTRTELVDPVAPINRFHTEDRLETLRLGIPLNLLPKAEFWPESLPAFYDSQLRPDGDSPDAVAAAGGEDGNGQAGGNAGDQTGGTSGLTSAPVIPGN